MWPKDLDFLTLAITVFVTPCLVLATPLVRVFEFFTVTQPDFFRSKNNAAKHKKKVENVKEQVVKWNKQGRINKMCTGRAGWETLSQRALNKSKFTKINIDLEDIIEIDTLNKVLRVEPGMKMGTLTHKLLSEGWTIPIIPELESLTVGGCVNGTGIETSSHKYGLFADSCLEFEIVLADGRVATCSKKENSELFYAISWSHGTLGFLTSVTLPISRASKYVKVEYKPTKSIEEAKNLLAEDNHDFVEGIMFKMDGIVVMHGQFIDEADTNSINYINRWYKPWFYKHVESVLENGFPVVEFIPLRDYYHRHQRGYFWEINTVFPLGNCWIVRYLLGWVYPINIQVSKLIISESLRDQMMEVDYHVLQDFLVPFSKLKDTLLYSHNTVEVYPIWLCPCKFFHTTLLAPLPIDSEEMYIDVGIYGISPKRNNFKVKNAIRKLEKFATECHGYQFLYADTYMTREEFSQMFPMEAYNALREKYNCKDAFPEIYDKVSREARIPSS